MKGLVYYYPVVFVFWLVSSGKTDFINLSLGLVAIVFTMEVYRKYFYTSNIKRINLIIIFSFLKYVINLISCILKAGIQVTEIVMSRKINVSPRFIKVRKRFKTNLGKVIAATTITLTPGTLTIDFYNDTFILHALNSQNAEEMVEWPMEKVILELEDAFYGN
ncbi:multicomponent Na+:H+ antiporter subunit E [Caldanaerovirga acetigignens]|jgi:multicomponent Na+:H+ antiporter subunit E|uniref:Multicomponent Na+:H+ antiporter subunit E n=1 Tax=Caldanaerovirga acetigignens TaxID=447595 RepID=A0A1M7JJN7_9FIRM|nr:Na+/H+ antiporter subunit E [Caldanaerovirga acetigignens]SHM53214.1 multicomponent Na+:H+ antiporter subunit E [Caldanaerovirga acetigignens]